MTPRHTDLKCLCEAANLDIRDYYPLDAMISIMSKFSYYIVSKTFAECLLQYTIGQIMYPCNIMTPLALRQPSRNIRNEWTTLIKHF